jgi:hypothetical protein
MKKTPVTAALLTVALTIVVPAFMRAQVNANNDFKKTGNSIQGMPTTAG